MSRTVETDICVIGAGSGGLSVAAGAAQMGARVVLVEKGEMGGDCLNYGCVPSKALLAAGKHAHAMRHGAAFGIAPLEPQVDFAAVRQHVHGVIAAIAPHDSQERFEGLGVTVIREAARFAGPRTVQAGETRIEAKYVVVATGSSPFVPPIEGLDGVPYFTNETIFGNDVRPEHLIVVGGGPIGMEMAQAHRRLGSQVTVLEGMRALGKDDPEAAAIVLDRLRGEGIDIREQAKVVRVAPVAEGVAVTVERNGREETVTGSHLLVAVGRKANVEGLNLEAGNVAYDRRGISVDSRLRSTTNSRVFAIGDVAGQLQFTHVAGYHAGIAIRNMLFWLPAKASMRAMPWATYTDPELAHVGMAEAEAKKAHSDASVLRWTFKENDRAQAERRTEGIIKAVVRGNGEILGATVVGPHAADLLLPWVLAVEKRMKIGTLAGLTAPYPTLGEVSKRVAGSYYTPKLFSDRTRRLVRFLMRWS
ncbi:dihydrolipoyl dehydrogenase family protein [Futiania mangrovi]|uniref:FAD-dependent oxidoreductase n=1 Tax=Futiania mangrovi TaxID=2959716 RepID=A0A9J6PNV6_9PROT|nr:FAD-dependent oxidoreductase [Futiania mangrovii]MCP1337770.1 FAD-dependent oxidoreductase [Futiania mangrovii]